MFYIFIPRNKFLEPLKQNMFFSCRLKHIVDTNSKLESQELIKEKIIYCTTKHKRVIMQVYSTLTFYIFTFCNVICFNKKLKLIFK